MSIIRQLGAFTSLGRLDASLTRFVLLASLGLAACAPADDPEYTVGPPLYVPNTCAATVSTLGPDNLFLADVDVSPALAVAGGALFWVDRGAGTDTIQSASLSGGSASTVFTASPDATAAIEDLTTDGTSLYFIQTNMLSSGSYSSTISSLPLAGGRATVLAATQTDDLTLTVADGYVYFTDGQTVQRVSTTGGSVEQVDGGGARLASDGTAVYWTDASSSLVKLASATAPQVTIAENLPADSSLTLPTLVANASSVFWPCQDNNGGLLCSASTSAVNGPIEILGTLDIGSSQLIADDSNVYFVDTSSCTSWLGKVSVHGGAVTTLASGFSNIEEPSDAHALALDDTYVYWTVPGQIFRVAK